MYNFKFCNRIKQDRHFRRVVSAFASLLVSIAYAIYNGYLGIAACSTWFGAMCAYYLVLMLMRFFVLTTKETAKGIGVFVGVCMIVLGFVLGGINYLSETKAVAEKYGTIPMITIAVYTFYKITMSAIRAAKYHGRETTKIECINVISYAEVAVSILSMQRSMLVSFEGMNAQSIRIFNVGLGSVVWIFILILGMYLINRREN